MYRDLFISIDDESEDVNDGAQPPSPIHQVCVGCDTPQSADAFCDLTSIEKSTLPNVTVMADFGQTDFGQTDFGQF